MASFTYTICFLLVATLMLVTTVKAEGCFENPEIFREFTQYIQTLSLENRIYYDPVSDSDPKKMTAQTEKNLPKYWKKTYTCIEEYEGNRILVEVWDEMKKKLKYQCLQYKPLTDKIIRQAKTKWRSSKEGVNCETDKYFTDEALLVAVEVLKPEPCPLTGGYQMLLHEGEIIKGHCLDSVLSYNPSMRFECDGHNVIADFGQDCEPPMLGKFQKMRHRHIAHLSCVGSWNETGDIKSVLLHMRDMPYDLWCIHYKQMNETYDLLTIFMTLDGRCVEDAFHDESFPKKTSLFGHLAKYTPSNDRRCSDSEYLSSCEDNEAKCFESNECPSNCKRCNKKPSKSPCIFMQDTQGSWKTVDSRQEMHVDVADNSFHVSGYGKFSCRDEADRDLPGRVYPVVQSDDVTSCLPYYACAHIQSPLPGLLNFKLQPAWRDESSGQPFSCKRTDDKIGFVTPVADEKMITMLDFEKLQKSTCGVEMALYFPTIEAPCALVVEECGDDCSNLNIQYDNDTCVRLAFEIETDHICYGRLNFDDGMRGLLTYSEFSDRYFCWIFDFEHLLISNPDSCNAERVKYMLADHEALITYDPARMLMKPVHEKSKDPEGNGLRFMPNYVLMLFTFCLFFFYY